MGGRGYSSATNRKGVKGKVQQDHYPARFGDATPQAAAFTANELGISPEEAMELNYAVRRFTGTAYSDIREHQRDGDGDEETQKRAENLERFIELAPKWGGGTTYRGINVEDDGYTLKALTTIGAEVSMGGSSSWSTDENTARSFARGSESLKVVFRSPTQSRGTSVRHLSGFYEENEVVASMHSRYRVTKVTQKDTYYYIDVKEF